MTSARAAAKRWMPSSPALLRPRPPSWSTHAARCGTNNAPPASKHDSSLGFAIGLRCPHCLNYSFRLYCCYDHNSRLHSLPSKGDRFMKELLSSCAALAFVFLMPTSPALAWGVEGHEVVGSIADQLLTGHPAKAKVASILGFELRVAAPWLDCIRSVVRHTDGTFEYSPNPHFHSPSCLPFETASEKAIGHSPERASTTSSARSTRPSRYCAIKGQSPRFRSRTKRKPCSCSRICWAICTSRFMSAPSIWTHEEGA
jgi:hypothetical protein